MVTWKKCRGKRDLWGSRVKLQGEFKLQERYPARLFALRKFLDNRGVKSVWRGCDRPCSIDLTSQNSFRMRRRTCIFGTIKHVWAISVRYVSSCRIDYVAFDNPTFQLLQQHFRNCPRGLPLIIQFTDLFMLADYDVLTFPFYSEQEARRDLRFSSNEKEHLEWRIESATISVQELRN